MLVLTTARLNLRWVRLDDAALLLRLVTDPDWLRHIGDRGVKDLASAERFATERLIANYWRQGHGFWAIEDKVRGVFLGIGGLVHRPALPAIDVGYALLPEHRGRGYAREVAAACLDYAATVLGRTRVLAIVSPANQKSLATLAAVGMRRIDEVVLPGESKAVHLHEWRSPLPGPRDDREAIRTVVQRALDACRSLAPLPHFCTPGARFVVGTGGGDPRGLDLRSFVTERVAPRPPRLRIDRERGNLAATTTSIHGPFARHMVGDDADAVADAELVHTHSGWRVARMCLR